MNNRTYCNKQLSIIQQENEYLAQHCAVLSNLLCQHPCVNTWTVNAAQITFTQTISGHCDRNWDELNKQQ